MTTQHFIDSEETVDRSGDTGPNQYQARRGEGGSPYEGPMNVVGGAGQDTFIGQKGNDWFKDSGGGSDASGGGGRDYLEGGNGPNTLRGGWGNDILVGNQKDQIADRLYGGSHNDFLIAGKLKASNRQDDGTGALTDGTRGRGPTSDQAGDPQGSLLHGGHGGDHFILNPDSYVYIEDFLNWYDYIYVTGIRDGAKLTIVHHPDGHYGKAHFRIMLGNKVLAELKFEEEVNPDDAEAVRVAKGKIDEFLQTASGDWINGDHNDNSIQGTAYSDHIYGHGGEDTLKGGAGDDALVGGNGNDVLRGGDGDDRLQGGDANDTLWGGAGMDSLDGDGGNDLLYGGGGDDGLYGGDGHDRLDGGDGRDVLYGNAGRDIFVISEGRSSDGAADIIGDFKIGEDYIRLPFSISWDDVRFVRSITDPNDVTTHLVTGTGDSQKVLARFQGFENLTAQQLQELKNQVEFIWDFDPNEEYPDPQAGKTLKGTNKKDMLVGGTDNDTIEGLGAADVLYGRGGDDTLFGGSGKDMLYGGSGDDFLHGDNNNDILHGGAGSDTLNGGKSADRLYGEDGDDTLNGGNGDDMLYGGAGSDELDGGDGNDRLEGGEGDLDVLAGGAGEDRLFGNGGNDRLEGGRDADRLRGGEGADEFLFRRGDGVDVITDFEDGTDTIVFLAQTEAKAGTEQKFLSFSDLVLTDSEEAGGVVITSDKLEGNEIIVRGVTSEMLTADDFGFLTVDQYNEHLDIA